MTGNNGFRVPDPFERSYGGAAPWEQKDREPDAEPCELCDGTGEIDDSAGGVGPAAHTKHPCPDCNGEGTV